MNVEIESYNNRLSIPDKAVCNRLVFTIDRELAGVKCKIWHGHPVWFLEDNPIAGYGKLKDGVQLLFWSGQSFEEEELQPEGNFKEAGIRYTSMEQIDHSELKI